METTLFNVQGQPVAYLSDDGEKIFYLWSGHTVAYVEGETLYGWNGKHLGWFADGVIRDLNGYRVGSVQEKCPSAPHDEPPKHVKLARYAKAEKHAASVRPTFSTEYSDENLEDFLKQGVT